MVCLGIASGPVLAVLTRWRYWTAVPFSFGFWSFSFPLAAMAGATVEAVQRGGWPPAVALTAVLIASTVIALVVTNGSNRGELVGDRSQSLHVLGEVDSGKLCGNGLELTSNFCWSFHFWIQRFEVSRASIHPDKYNAGGRRNQARNRFGS